jgi:hypothetical protein
MAADTWCESTPHAIIMEWEQSKMNIFTIGIAARPPPDQHGDRQLINTVPKR